MIVAIVVIVLSLTIITIALISYNTSGASVNYQGQPWTWLLLIAGLITAYVSIFLLAYDK